MATVDTLQINIETNSGQAGKSISSLTSAITKLSKQAQNIEQISSVFASIRNAINKVNESSIARVERLSAACGDLAYSVSQLKKANNIAKLVSSITAANEKAQSTLSGGGAKSDLADATKKIAEGSQEAAVGIKKVGDEAKKTEAKTKVAAGGFSKLLKSIGRVAFYRAIRTMLKEITQAFKEGLDNIDAWSKAINDPDIINAHEVLSKYNTEWLKVKNTLGAIVSPALQALLPIFEKITDKIIVAGNELAKFMTIVADSNADYYVGINPNVFQEYANSISKVNKQLQKFDELNNLTTKDKGANDTDYSKYFDKFDLTEDEKSKFNRLKDELEVIGEAMAAIWAVSQVTKWGDTIASLFAEGGKAGVLGSLIGFATKGVIVIGLTFAVDWFLKEKTGKGIGGWIEQFINDNLAPKDRTIDFSFKEMWAQITKGMPETLEEWKSDFGYLFSGLWVDLWKYYAAPSLNKIGEKMSEVKNEFVKGFNNVFGAIGSVFRGDTKVQREFNSWWDKNVNQPIGAFLLNNPLATLVDWCGKLPNAWNNLVDRLKGKAEPQIDTSGVSEFAENVENAIEVWGKLAKGEKVNLEAVLKLTTEMGLDIDSDPISYWTEHFEEFRTKVVKFIEEIRKDLTTALTSGGNPLNNLANFSTNLFTKLKAFLDDLATVGTNITNAIAGGGKTEPAVIKHGASKFMVQAFANGGYPTGDLFIANEAGAEMVGSIGGRTAVANNDQITTAIATACYNAMSQALSENGMNVTIEGDANQMFKVVQRQARQYRQTTGSYAF